MSKKRAGSKGWGQKVKNETPSTSKVVFKIAGLVFIFVTLFFIALAITWRYYHHKPH